jgi:predicted nucleic acid-binding protein
MRSFDTNIAVHAASTASPLHQRAYEFVASLGSQRDVAVCELMLVELYLKLRNEKVFSKPSVPPRRLPSARRIGTTARGC